MLNNIPNDSCKKIKPRYIGFLEYLWIPLLIIKVEGDVGLGSSCLLLNFLIAGTIKDIAKTKKNNPISEVRKKSKNLGI